jgi:branched-chain amino acid transport system permease protein
MHTQKTVEVLTMVYIGGRGSMWGGMLVSFPFIFVINYLRSNLENLPGLHLVIFGVAMILVMIFYPGGASAAIEGVAGWVKARLPGTREG